MREWTIVSGMEARACCVCLAWASFGLRDVHVKTNGFFSLFRSSMTAVHDCMCASAAAVKESTHDTLLLFEICCTSNLAVVFGVSVSILVVHT